MARLWLRTFRNTNAAPSESLTRYFREVFLEHPWFDAELAPLVMEQAGEVVAFIGRMHRPMTFAGRPIRVAVAAQLMVDPERKLGFAALELVRALQGGPQDLAFSDGANEQALRIWERCGGRGSRLLSFEWTRVLRPMQTKSQHLQDRAQLASLARLAHPALGMVDRAGATLAPWLYRRPGGRLSRRDASAAEIVPLMQQAGGGALVAPVYTAQSYAWLLEKAAEAREFGPMRTRLVLDDDGTAIGWFVYYVRPGQSAHVLQVGTMPAQGRAVLAELFRDAWEAGAANVSGGLDPRLITEISNCYCSFRSTCLGVLVHSRDAELLAAVERGDAVLSRLEGEWWLRFGIDRHAAW